MAIKLRPEVRSNVKAALAAALPGIPAGGYIGMNFAFMAVDAALPKKNAVRDQLAEYLGDFPLSEFVNDVLTEDLENREDFKQFGSNHKLTDLKGYEDPSAISENLINRFETLPWSYMLTLRLPHHLHDLVPINVPRVELGANLHVCRGTTEFQRTFPLTTDNLALKERLLGPPPGPINPRPPNAQAYWDRDEVYLQIQTAGFIGRYGHSQTTQTAKRLLRSFIGFGLATELFEEHSYFRSYSDAMPIYVHRASTHGTWQPLTRFNLSASVARGIYAVYITGTDPLRIKSMDTAWLDAKLSRIRDALNVGDGADQARLAAQWFFDGATGDDPLLTFVQSMVVLEILLGNKVTSDEGVSISTLISNRFAYLVGQTHEERDRYISTFKKIYAVRSQIVHSGRTRLRSEDHHLRKELLWMGRAAITKEIDMLLTPKPKK